MQMAFLRFSGVIYDRTFQQGLHGSIKFDSSKRAALQNDESSYLAKVNNFVRTLLKHLLPLHIGELLLFGKPMFQLNFFNQPSDLLEFRYNIMLLYSNVI